MYPDRDTLSSVPRLCYIAARDQSMVQSDVIESGNFNLLCMNARSKTKNMEPEPARKTIQRAFQLSVFKVINNS